MAITITFSCKSTPRERTRVIHNLCLLLTEIEPAQFVLLDSVDVEIEFRRGPRPAPRLNDRPQMLVLATETFEAFEHRTGRKPSTEHRQGLHELKSEVLRALDRHTHFSRSRPWRKAVFPPRRSSWARLAFWRTDAAARQALIDVLLDRDELRATIRESDDLEREMETRCPGRYALALRFETELRARAIGIAVAKHPDLIADSDAALRRAFRDVNLTWRPLEASTEVN